MESIVVIDDDEVFRTRLVRAFASRNVRAVGAANELEARTLLREQQRECALIDLRLGEESGLELVRSFRTLFPDLKMVVLTGYGSIATALEAVKLGAVNYLTKPAGIEEIVNAFAKPALADVGSKEEAEGASEQARQTIPVKTPSLARAEWEHLQRVLQDCEGNVTHAATRLGIPRRTLQRKLLKDPPRA